VGLMKTVEINKYHPFVEEYDQTFREKLKPTKGTVYKFEDHKKFIKEWFDYEVDVDPHGFTGRLTMTDEQYTLFLLRWA
jgi:hypothetical protein